MNQSLINYDIKWKGGEEEGAGRGEGRGCLSALEWPLWLMLVCPCTLCANVVLGSFAAYLLIWVIGYPAALPRLPGMQV